MVGAYSYGRTGVDMTVFSRMVKLTVVGGSFIREEISMKAIGKMIKYMDMGFSGPRTEADMRVNGSTINKMDQAKKLGLMAQPMRDTMLTE